MGPNFSFMTGWVAGLDWVSQLVGWIRLGQRKWTHGHLCMNFVIASHTTRHFGIKIFEKLSSMHELLKKSVYATKIFVN